MNKGVFETVATLHGGKKKGWTGEGNREVYVKVLVFTNGGFMYAYYIIKNNQKIISQ